MSSFIYSFFSARPFDRKLGSSLIFFFFICTRPFDQIIGSSFIYYFFSARPFDHKLGSLLIFFFHLHTTIREKYMIFFHLFFLRARPLDQKLRSSLIFLFVTTIRPKLRIILTLKFIIFFIVPIFCLQYCFYILSATIIHLYFVHYIHRSAALIFRTLYPLQYELLA